MCDLLEVIFDPGESLGEEIIFNAIGIPMRSRLIFENLTSDIRHEKETMGPETRKKRRERRQVSK
jgi:hypothetical protein